MKKTFKRLLSGAIALVLLTALTMTAFAAPGDVGNGGGGSLVDGPSYVPMGNLVTFKEGSSYDLTAKPGTVKSPNGDVMVNDVMGVINKDRIPAVAGSDAYYQFVAWAIENEDGTLEFVDLTTYKFTKAAKLVAVTEDTWPVYNDMKQDRSDWFYTYVRDLSVQEILGGYPGYIFKPQNNVTWGEALKLIMLATGYEAQEAIDDHWASGYLAKAEADALVAVGYVTDLQKSITRQEYAEVASKAMGLKDVDIDTPFADTDDQEILNLYNAGIVGGSFDAEGNRLYKPADMITRAEMCTVIWRINAYYKAN